jgi:putative transposase
MVDQMDPLPVTRQCELLELPRSTFYYVAKPVSDEELDLMVLIDRCHLEHPYYGSRRVRGWLEDEGGSVSRKRVQRLMRTMGITALYPKRMANQAHKMYPYLLRDLVIDLPNQVSASDVTYSPIARGFVYLVAIMDKRSRKVLSWRVSNTLDTSFCVDALNEAIETYGPPKILNTDQGCQFTSEEFTGVLKQHDIRISMDGKGRWVDNVFFERLWRSVKYEEVVCYERDRCGTRRKRCFTRDEGRPLGVGLREQASNRHKPRGLRAFVVSVVGKGGAGLRQVGIKETNASEPLMTCRNVQNGVETGARISVPRRRLGVTRLLPNWHPA